MSRYGQYVGRETDRQTERKSLVEEHKGVLSKTSLKTGLVEVEVCGEVGVIFRV